MIKVSVSVFISGEDTVPAYGRATAEMLHPTHGEVGKLFDEAMKAAKSFAGDDTVNVKLHRG